MNPSIYRIAQRFLLIAIAFCLSASLVGLSAPPSDTNSPGQPPQVEECPAPANNGQTPKSLATEFEELKPDTLWPMPDEHLALPVSGYYPDPNDPTVLKPISSYPFFNLVMDQDELDQNLKIFSDSRSPSERYLLRHFGKGKIECNIENYFPANQHDDLKKRYKDISVYTNHPAPMPRTAPAKHYRLCVPNKYNVGRQDLNVGFQVPGIQSPPTLFTTYVRTPESIYPDPVKDLGLTAGHPPGTNLLPTVYRNLINRFGNEIPNTLPSHPNNPYNLHDGPPKVSRLKTHSSPADDLRYIMENLYEDVTGESPERLWEYVEQDLVASDGDEDNLRDHLHDLVEKHMSKRDSLERRWQQMQVHTQWAIDIIEGNSGNGSRVPSNRAYSGFPLLNHSGHKRIGRVKPIFDEHGHVIGGNVDVHQIWFDGRVRSDNMFFDFGWDDDPEVWKPAAPGVRNELPIPAEVPWTITYTVDVLNNGEDDFSPMTMYFDAPERMKLPFETVIETVKKTIDELVTENKLEKGDRDQLIDRFEAYENEIDSAQNLPAEIEILNRAASGKGRDLPEIPKWVEVKESLTEELQKAAKEQVEKAVNLSESSHPVPMVFAGGDEGGKPFVKTRSKLGLWNASMDQTFFPMEAGNRYVFKIKMAPAQYFNLTYTWGWRRHPPRAQAVENSHKRVPPRTPEQLSGLQIVAADEECPRLLPPSLFSQMRISDHERLVSAGLTPGGDWFGDRKPGEPTVAEQYADDPIPITILMGNDNNPKPIDEGYINEVLGLDESDWGKLPESLREFVGAPGSDTEFRKAWEEPKNRLKLTMQFMQPLFVMSGADKKELREIREMLQARRFAVMSNMPFFELKTVYQQYKQRVEEILTTLKSTPASRQSVSDAVDNLDFQEESIKKLHEAVKKLEMAPGSNEAQFNADKANLVTFIEKLSSSKEAPTAKYKPIAMISDLAPAKRMWRTFHALNDMVIDEWGDPVLIPTDLDERRKFGKDVLNLVLAARTAFLEWKDRTKLPSGLKPDIKSEVTILYVNNTMYGEFKDGGKHTYPKWRKRGDAVKVTLVNGDYFPHGYLNVDFGANRGWENQFKPTLQLGGPGMFFTFGRFYWKWNTEPGAIGVPPAVKQRYVLNDQKMLTVVKQSDAHQGADPDLKPGQAFVLRSEKDLIALKEAADHIDGYADSNGNIVTLEPDANYLVLVKDITDESGETPLSPAGTPIYDGSQPDAVRPFVHRLWIEMNHDPTKRLRFYQFDPLHHDMAIFSLH